MEVPDLPSKIKKLFVIFVNMFNQEPGSSESLDRAVVPVKNRLYY